MKISEVVKHSHPPIQGSADDRLRMQEFLAEEESTTNLLSNESRWATTLSKDADDFQY